MIAVLNQATQVTNPEAATMARACAHQLRYDAAPAWGRVPWGGVIFYTHVDHVPPGAWRIVIFDDPDQAGVLGWHSEGPDGLPFGRVFANPVLNAGGDVLTKDLSVASVLSHEVLEAFVDPSVNLNADDFAGGSWALEVGDPVESDSYAVPVALRDGTTVQVTVSDFAYPGWFDAQSAGPYDHLRLVERPFTLRPGGYAIKNGAAVWGEKYPGWRRQIKEREFLEARAARAATSAGNQGDVLEAAVPLGRSAHRVSHRPIA